MLHDRMGIGLVRASFWGSDVTQPIRTMRRDAMQKISLRGKVFLITLRRSE